MGERIMTDKEYVDLGGGSCPFCGSENIEGGLIEISVGIASQECRCHENDCGREWVDNYDLVGFTVIEKNCDDCAVLQSGDVSPCAECKDKDKFVLFE